MSWANFTPGLTWNCDHKTNSGCRTGSGHMRTPKQQFKRPTKGNQFGVRSQWVGKLFNCPNWIIQIHLTELWVLLLQLTQTHHHDILMELRHRHLKCKTAYLEFEWICSFSGGYMQFLPPANEFQILGEGNVFTGVCLFIRDGYPWYQIPSGVGMSGPFWGGEWVCLGWVCPGGGYVKGMCMSSGGMNPECILKMAEQDFSDMAIATQWWSFWKTHVKIKKAA